MSTKVLPLPTWFNKFNFRANTMPSSCQVEITIHFKPFEEMALYLGLTGFIVNQFVPFQATLIKFEMEGSIG